MVAPNRQSVLPGYRFHLALGGVLTFFGIAWMAVVLVCVFTPELHQALPANLGLAVLGFLTPGVALSMKGRARRLREERMIRAAELATAAGRVPVAEVAETLQAPTDVARQALLDAVGTGRLTGRLDVERGVFTVLSAEDAGPSREVTFQCRTCGASSKSLVAPGEKPRCGYCGAVN